MKVTYKPVETFGEVIERPYMVQYWPKDRSRVIYWRLPLTNAPCWVVAEKRRGRQNQYDYYADLNTHGLTMVLRHFGLRTIQDQFSFKSAEHLPPVHFARRRRGLDEEFGIPHSSVLPLRSIDSNYQIPAMFCS